MTASDGRTRVAMMGADSPGGHEITVVRWRWPLVVNRQCREPHEFRQHPNMVEESIEGDES
jgi:hypothetical protein